MLESANALGKVRVVIPASNDKALAKIREIVDGAKCAHRVEVVAGGARELLCRAWCAVVASGTATLEASLAKCPTVLVYKVSAVFAWIARRVIKGISHIGLINIIWEKAGRGNPFPMAELLQEDFTPLAVANIVGGWLSSDIARNEAVRRLDEAVALLEADKSAYAQIVDAIKN
jgi:lipid-A-disaccharide synthase